MDDALAHLLELRLRARGRPEATALIDRAIRILSRAMTAEAHEVPALDAEVEALRMALEARFGRKAPLTVH